jgi:hypothetical protein
MEAEVSKVIGRSDLAAEIDVWLYRAMLDLGTYRKFQENRKKATLTLAAAANTANIHTDFVAPIRLEYNDGSTLDIVQFKDLIYVRDNFSVGVTGFPNYYARHGGVFYFDRTADQEYAMDHYYKFRPEDYDDDTDTSDFGEEWDQALLLWAESEAFRRMREWEASQESKMNYYSYVKGRLGDLEKEEEAWNESLVGDIDADPYSF